MRPQYRPNFQQYDQYFASQKGRGLPYYAGARVQRGHGIGGIFKSLGAAILPTLKAGGKFLGKQLLSTGAQVVNDILEGQSFSDSIKQRGKAGLQRTVKAATEGIKRRRAQPARTSGIKRRRTQVGRTPGIKRRRVQPPRTLKSRKVADERDIFD